MPTSQDQAAASGLRATARGIFYNAVLAGVKALAGWYGNSLALLADAIESLSDVLTSLIVFVGIKLARKPADKTHPYGHGKIEPMAATIVALVLLAAAVIISIASLREIYQPQAGPEPFTLMVLLLVILVKEGLFRRVVAIGREIRSTAVLADAWHHRSDAITSAAAFIGISIALVGGKGFESADDFAALFAAMVIGLNAYLILKPAVFELLDTAPDPAIAESVRKIAGEVPGVYGTHKCHVRKLGFDYFVDLDVLCDPDLSIRQGHEIAHQVGEAIHAAMPSMTRVLVHVEPRDDFGRRSQNLSRGT